MIAQRSKKVFRRTLSTLLVVVLLSLLGLATSALDFDHEEDEDEEEFEDDVPVLNSYTYEDDIKGKTSAFIKFYAPWCGHCRDMAPAWERLAKDYGNSAEYLVAKIDCTAQDSKTLCRDRLRIEAFPTLLFGDPRRGGVMMEEYHGERNYESLAAFAKDAFARPHCNMETQEGCSDEMKTEIQRYLRLSEAEVDAEIEKIEDEIDDIHDTFEESVELLQESYDEMSTSLQLKKTFIHKEIGWILEIKEVRTAPTQST